jgi:hypothetical protein
MITRLLSSLALAVLAALSLLMLVGNAHTALAGGETTFDVQLIWGTDGEKPKDKPFREVDPKFKDKLKSVFKWKNYYEVNRQALSIPKDGQQRLRLSDKCDIQVQDLGNSRVEVRLFGEGRPVVKKAQPVAAGESIVLAGDLWNDTAWFVVLQRSK